MKIEISDPRFSVGQHVRWNGELLTIDGDAETTLRVHGSGELLYFAGWKYPVIDDEGYKESHREDDLEAVEDAQS